MQANRDEISLKEIILKTKYFLKEVFSFWIWILVCCCIICGIQWYRYTQDTTKYKANIKFVVEGQEGSGGALGSLLGSFGISQSNGAISPFKILEVGRSYKILIATLFEKDEENEYLANILIDQYDLLDKISKEHPEFLNFKFTKIPNLDSPLKTESIALKKLQKLIWGTEKNRSKALVNFNFNEDKGVFTILSLTEQEDVSYLLTKKLYENIKFFFEEEVFLKQKQFADILQTKADSLENLRNQLVLELTQFRDRNRNIIASEILAKETILSQKQFAINSALVEIIKSKEMTDINLKDRKPLFLMIDYPFKPLGKDSPRLVFYLIIGFVIGVFISTVFILARRIYLDVMAKE